MRKIISLFKRDYDGNRQVYDEVVEGAEWVLAGEGVATEKVDGTCCLVAEGSLWKRRSVKPGKQSPAGFVHVDTDELTSRKWGWVPVGTGPEDRWHREAWGNAPAATAWASGTYELVGPKVQGNPYGMPNHGLWKHGAACESPHMPRDFEGLKKYFRDACIEGIVWHHPDGRMVKIKKEDFGFKWTGRGSD